MTQGLMSRGFPPVPPRSDSRIIKTPHNFVFRSFPRDGPPDITMWRENLVVGDPLRNWSILWRLETIEAPVALVADAGLGTVYDCDQKYISWERAEFEFYYWHAFVIPDDIPAGTYRVRCDGILTSKDVVVTTYTPPSTVTVLAPAGTGDGSIDNIRIMDALQKGDVVLLPGPYFISNRIIGVAGRKITGYGAHLVRIYSGFDYQQMLVEAADNMTFEGITFHMADMPASVGYGYFSNTEGAGTVFKKCTFMNGLIGYWNQYDCLLEGCTFQYAGVGNAKTGCYKDCVFQGFPGLGNSFLSEAAERMVVMNAKFDGTDRGLILRGTQGEHERNLFVGITFNNVACVINGNEICGAETAPSGINRSMFFRWDITGCRGQFNFWDANADSNLIVCVNFHGPGHFGIGLYGAGTPGAVQQNNVIQDCELYGCGVYMGATATDNQLYRVACLNYQQSALNQYDKYPGRYTLPPAVIYAEGPDADTNTVDYCTVQGQPSGVDDILGPTILH